MLTPIMRPILQPVLVPVDYEYGDGINPLSLFAAGEQGFWYDPSDFSTMFQDAAGTTPVTSVGQPVGRVNDKSGRGNHATQSTALSRPKVEARVNLFTKSEQFDDASWSKAAVTISANAVLAPDGTLTAERMTETASNSQHYVLQNAISGIYLATVSFYVKPNGKTRIGIRSEQPQTNNLSAIFDLTGVGSVVSGTGVITALPDGWYRCSATSTGNGTGASGYHLLQLLGPGNANTYLGDGVSGIYVWGAQLETGTSTTTYQRVNTATDYVDVGAPRYLSFDGTDDGMATPSIDFTGTDKMTVWAGVRKLSDAWTMCIAELSALTGVNPGAFILFNGTAGGSAGAAFTFRSAGSAAASADTPSSFASPVTAVLTGQGDISGDICRIRANGNPVTQTTDQGTGNYGNYPLYIGRRNGTSLPFSGRIYQLIGRGAETPLAQIQEIERYVNSKTGAY